jgi:hypothetical protein
MPGDSHFAAGSLSAVLATDDEARARSVHLHSQKFFRVDVPRFAAMRTTSGISAHGCDPAFSRRAMLNERSTYFQIGLVQAPAVCPSASVACGPSGWL